MSHFCLLKDPARYRALDWDLLADEAGREYWLSHFERHFAESMRHALRQYGRSAQKRIAAATEEFVAALQAIRTDPASLPSGKLDLIEFDRLREDMLGKHDLADPYARIRDRENASAAELYPEVVKTLHVMEDREKWLHLVRCVFAGNVFDLGSMATAHLADEPMDFLAAVEDTRERPWLVDDFDALLEEFLSTPLKWTQAVVFVDNAGADFVLGLMPLVRELALHGTMITLAANEGPALNDMMVDETVDIVNHLAAADRDLLALIDAGMIEVVSTGSTIPVLDLSDVSDELNEAAAEADLVILEGMARAVETNFDAAFTVDGLRLAIIKMAEVAERIGGGLYDCVCKYTPVDGQA